MRTVNLMRTGAFAPLAIFIFLFATISAVCQTLTAEPPQRAFSESLDPNVRRISTPTSAENPNSGVDQVINDPIVGRTAVEGDATSDPNPAPALPILDVRPKPVSTGVQWDSLIQQSLMFLSVQHGFRFATERGTRDGMRGPFLNGWYESLSSLHGWSDGDPFYVNYLGHPMQGAVSGFIFQANDPKYRAIEFGNNPDYWKSRLRAAAFSFVYSTQFEIGPLSEASLGKIQSTYPQQGFVDHVATPTIGTLWMIGEDALDRFVIRRIEGRTENPWLRMMARGWLNPARSFSNMMRLDVPWRRASRPGVWVYQANDELQRRESERVANHAQDLLPAVDSVKPWKQIAPFEFTVSTIYSAHPDGASGLNCIGGGATAVWNVGPVHSWVADVGGCKLFTFDPALSGDILNYRVGSRWSRRGGRIVPYGQVLVGGKRVTVERIPEEYRDEIRKIEQLPLSQRPPRSDYVDRQQTNGFAFSVGGGLEVPIKKAASLRLASFDYTKAWLPNNSIASYPDSYMVSLGLALRVGTW